jgi:predicted N-acetyltransferase YhbS
MQSQLGTHMATPDITQQPLLRGTPFLTRTARIDEINLLTDIDDDASALFVRAGLDLDLPPDHEFPAAERARLLRCLQAGTTLLALDGKNAAVGFVAVDWLDGQPYLAQLSVRANFTRLGIGSELLHEGLQIAQGLGGSLLRLTTYSHLPWNRPFYARHGFNVVPQGLFGPDTIAVTSFEQRWLPMPAERVVMERRL